MILQVAILNVRTGAEEEFETAFPQASSIISATPGYVSHQLQHCFFAKNASCAFEMATRP